MDWVAVSDVEVGSGDEEERGMKTMKREGREKRRRCDVRWWVEGA